MIERIRKIMIRVRGEGKRGVMIERGRDQMKIRVRFSWVRGFETCPSSSSRTRVRRKWRWWWIWSSWVLKQWWWISLRSPFPWSQTSEWHFLRCFLEWWLRRKKVHSSKSNWAIRRKSNSQCSYKWEKLEWQRVEWWKLEVKWISIKAVE